MLSNHENGPPELHVAYHKEKKAYYRLVIVNFVFIEHSRQGLHQSYNDLSERASTCKAITFDYHGRLLDLSKL